MASWCAPSVPARAGGGRRERERHPVAARAPHGPDGRGGRPQPGGHDGPGPAPRSVPDGEVPGGSGVARGVHDADRARPVHVRGLHYAAIDTRLPNGAPYTNTEVSYAWMQDKPAKASRWLGLV